MNRVHDDSEMRAAVRALMDPLEEASSFWPTMPAIVAIVALGRGAIPALVEILRGPEREFPLPGFRRMGAAWALAGLATDADLPIVRELLAEGISIVAVVALRLPGDAVRDVLLDSIRAGGMNTDVLYGLSTRMADPIVRATIVEWLAEAKPENGQDAGFAALYLGDSGATEAIPVLLRLVADWSESPHRTRLALALARLGAREGITVLIDSLRKAGGMDVWEGGLADDAGATLNRLAGRRIYECDRATGEANFTTAAAKFQTLWDQHPDCLHFDADHRRWRRRKSPPPPATESERGF